MRLRLGLAAVVAALALLLAGCQSLPMPTPSPTASGGGASQDGDEVDTSTVTGAEPADGLVDPCSLLTVGEIEAATGVSVTAVVRGAVKDDGSQICAYAMDAEGATAAAMAGMPGMPAGGLGDVVNGLEAGGAVVGVILSAQEPDVDYTGSDDPDDDPPPGLTTQQLDLGKGGVAVATPNGGAAIVANNYNVLLTIMDLIAGPADADSLASLARTAYGRL